MNDSTLSAAFVNKPIPTVLEKRGIYLALAGFLIAGIGFLIEPHRSLFMYLVLFMYLISLGLGPLFIITLEYLAGAVWSVPIRRVAEALVSILPAAAIIGIPLLFSMHSIFEWTHADVVAHDPILKGKVAWLNIPSFVIRYVLYFAIWITFWKIFTANSKKQDESKDQNLTTRNIRWSAFFMVLFAFTLTIAAVDWMMSLSPHWFSTMYGVYYFAGTVLSGFALLTLFVIPLKQKGYLHPKMSNQNLYPLGTFMFAFNAFWCYIAYSQFMLIWYGNIPEETQYFVPRWENGWQYYSIFLILIHFPVPFFGLISRPAKTNPNRLMFMAAWLLAVHFFDLYFLIMPSYHLADGSLSGPGFSFTDIGYPLIAAGLVLILFKNFANKSNLVPVGDPKLERGLNWHA
jgi:hypothetical protein